jgi:hypothetical protein
MVGPGERASQKRQRYMLETGQWSTPSVVNTNSDSGFSLPVTLDARLAQEQIWEDAERQNAASKRLGQLSIRMQSPRLRSASAGRDSVSFRMRTTLLNVIGSVRVLRISNSGSS